MSDTAKSFTLTGFRAIISRRNGVASTTPPLTLMTFHGGRNG